jgi:hypothetical protein
MRAWALKLTATRLPALSLGRFEYLHGTLAGLLSSLTGTIAPAM